MRNIDVENNCLGWGGGYDRNSSSLGPYSKVLEHQIDAGGSINFVLHNSRDYHSHIDTCTT